MLSSRIERAGGCQYLASYHDKVTAGTGILRPLSIGQKDPPLRYQFGFLVAFLVPAYVAASNYSPIVLLS